MVRMARRHRGLGLVEVMIAMAIGMLLLGALAYFFIGSKRMSTTQNDVARMQESARNAMEVIGKAVRQAGYQLDTAPFVDFQGTPVSGTDGGTMSGQQDPPDTLTLQQDPAWKSDPANSVAGVETDCSGAVITSANAIDPVSGKPTPNTALVSSGFSITGTNLMCDTSGNNPASGGVIVADNIENMQINYAICALGFPETVMYYTPDPTGKEARVSAVRVSLLVRGPTGNMVPGGSQTFMYNDSSVTTTDGHLRQVYTSTFRVRNIH